MYPPLSNQKLKYYHKLNQKKYRDSESLYLTSGLRAVQSVIANNLKSIITLIVSKESIDLLDGINVSRKDHLISTISKQDFAKLNNEKTPQGICAVVRRPETKFNEKQLSKRIVFLEKINDPGNLGTIIRSAAWFGYTTLLLSTKCADPFQPKAVRSSAGEISALQILENVGSKDIKRLQSKYNYRIYGTDVSQGHDLSSLFFAEKTLLMLGSEAHGLSAEYIKLSETKINISKRGSGESLNLANAASIIMYQSTLHQ